MKAWQIERHGGPEVLQLVDKKSPELSEDSVRVTIHAIGINHLDLWVRNGVPGHRFPLPITPGSDAAGVVESCGSKVQAFRPGQRVLINPDQSPGSTAVHLLGETADGVCQESVVVPPGQLVLLPDSIDFETAASLPIAYVTAWAMLVHRARLQKGEVVLIQAAGSGVSVAATLIAKAMGATVFTTARSQETLKKSKAAGADEVFLHPFRDALKAKLKSIGRKGVDVVIDHVGEATMTDSLKSLDWKGRLVTCGATSGADIKIDLKPVFFKKLSILGSTMGQRGDLEAIVGWVSQGKIRPVVDSVFPFEDYPKALQKLERRKVFGKVVLKCSH